MRKELTAERLRELLSYDPLTGVFVWLVSAGSRAAGAVAGAWHPEGYRHIRLDGRLYLAHRLAHLYMTGTWPKEHLDHINLNKADNRFFNLREATLAQNQANARKRERNASGYKNVCWDKSARKWRADINVNGKQVYLGLFRDLARAAIVAQCAARIVYGEFSRAA